MGCVLKPYPGTKPHHAPGTEHPKHQAGHIQPGPSRARRSADQNSVELGPQCPEISMTALPLHWYMQTAADKPIGIPLLQGTASVEEATWRLDTASCLRLSWLGFENKSLPKHAQTGSNPSGAGCTVRHAWHFLVALNCPLTAYWGQKWFAK